MVCVRRCDFYNARVGGNKSGQVAWGDKRITKMDAFALRRIGGDSGGERWPTKRRM